MENKSPLETLGETAIDGQLTEEQSMVLMKYQEGFDLNEEEQLILDALVIRRNAERERQEEERAAEEVELIDDAGLEVSEKEIH